MATKAKIKAPPKVTVKPVTAWSPSGLDGYESCPRAFLYDRVWNLCKFCFKGSMIGKPRKCTHCKRDAPPQPLPLAKGEAVHEVCEMTIRGQQKSLPTKVMVDGEDGRKEPVALKWGPVTKARLKSLAAGYKLRKVRTELELAFTKAWKLCEWMSPSVWLRVKVDVLELNGKKSIVTDWKTGQPKPEKYDDQLNLYACAALSAGFGEQTTAQLHYTDQDKVVETDAGQMKLVQLGRAQTDWDKRAKKLLVDTSFVPRPGQPCRYCSFSANKGGPCEF